MATQPKRRLGLIVNSIAGLGGPAALKGTDDPGAADTARARGAVAQAGRNAQRCLSRLRAIASEFELVVGQGAMGADAAAAGGLSVIAVGPPSTSSCTTAADTRQIASLMVASGVDLLVFSGGDGTACDIVSVCADAVPMLGIPSGVKMYSGVFAISPEAAGAVIEGFLLGRHSTTIEAEIMDVDEAALRSGEVSARLFGYARTIDDKIHIAGPKQRGYRDDAELEAASAEAVADLEPGAIHLIGPGTAMRNVKRRLGIEGTLLGVDAFRGGQVIGLDLTESQIFGLIVDRPARIFVGLIGGQGFIFGRGNQQLSARVIRHVGREHVTVIASQAKLTALMGRPLRVDTGDLELDRQFAGHIRIVTGAGRSAILRIAAPESAVDIRQLIRT